MSKDSLRNLVGLSGEFVGTTDAAVLTNKTMDAQLNTFKQTTPAAGTLLKDDGTKFSPLARGAANLPLKVNSAGTDLQYAALTVPGGGTGATTLTGVLIGAGTANITTKANPTGAFLDDSSVQNITGAKTFSDQALKLRNPANTFTMTVRNPAVTANVDFRYSYQYDALIFTDGTTIFVKNGRTGAIDHSGTDFQVEVKYAFDNILTAGRTYKEKVVIRGNYTLNQTLTIPDYTIVEGPCKITAKNGFSTSTPTHMISYSTTPSRTTAQFIELRWLEVDGNKANQTHHQNALVGGPHDTIIANCHIYNCNTTGIQIHEDQTYGVQDQRQCQILNNWVHDVGHIGIYLGYGISDVLVMGNYGYNNGGIVIAGSGIGEEGSGIFLDGDGQRNQIINNWCYNNTKTGCFITEQANLYLSGLYSWDNNNSGLVIAGTDAMTPPNMPAFRNQINNVWVWDNVASGVWAHGCQNTTFNNIIAYNNGADGFLLSNDLTNTPPVPSDPVCDNVTISDSLFYGNTFNGITIRGKAGLLAKNIKVLNCVSKNHPATKTGITISQCSNVRIQGCQLYDDQGTPTQQYGIVTGSTADGVYIYFNHFFGNTTRGINHSTATNVKLLGNTGTYGDAPYEDAYTFASTSAPSDPAADNLRRYPRRIDTNNDGMFYKAKINGAVREVLI